eukprot:364284-Chlamydomonas_euryale.AAC.1
MQCVVSPMLACPRPCSRSSCMNCKGARSHASNGDVLLFPRISGHGLFVGALSQTCNMHGGAASSSYSRHGPLRERPQGTAIAICCSSNPTTLPTPTTLCAHKHVYGSKDFKY